MKLGILPLARPTFDVAFAETKLTAMLKALDDSGHEIIGPRELLFDEEDTVNGLQSIKQADVDQVLVLQITFTDASMVVSAAAQFAKPLSIWAVPEPRIGGRLRLNSFCGLNLAAHALGLNHREFSFIYLDPEQDIKAELTALLAGERKAGKLPLGDIPQATDDGLAIAEAIKHKRIARIGEHPAGFDTCAYDQNVVKEFTGVDVDAYELEHLFSAAKNAPQEVALALREKVAGQVEGLDDVDQDELDRSLRLKAGLDDIRKSGNYDAFAIRCWPETFTEYGGAVCGPVGMLGEEKVPCACEADIYGALTQLVLLQAAQEPVFMTDLVDIDVDDDSAVVWHCGQAPISMRDPECTAEATIHTNRKQPLLYQFTLKPGPVTLMRISKAHNRPHMVLSYGEMLRRPMAYTGTSGVVRFQNGAKQVLGDLIASGLEHHMAIAYGDHRDTLRGVAGAMGLNLLEL